MEPPETDMFLPSTRGRSKGMTHVWKLVGWEMWQRKDESWTRGKNYVKRSKNYGPHFGVSSKKGSHTKRSVVESKAANKYVRTTIENQKEKFKVCLWSLSPHDMLFLIVQLTRSTQLSCLVPFSLRATFYLKSVVANKSLC